MADDTIARIVAFSKTQRGQYLASQPFFPNPAEPSLPNPNRYRKLTKFSESYKDLAGGFEVSENEIKDWLESKFFAPFWEVYLKEYLGPARKAAAQSNSRSFPGAGLRAVITRIKQFESNGIAKYSTEHPEKEKWIDLDHLAFFLFRCQRENKNNRNGIFFNKDWPVEQQYHAIWQAKGFKTNPTTKTREEKRTLAGSKRKRDESDA